MQTLNQLNEENEILQSDIDTKDAAIASLEQAMNECPKIKTDMSMVIVIPSSDEIVHHGGRVVKITVNTLLAAPIFSFEDLPTSLYEKTD